MRLSEEVETNLGKFTVKELTPTHISDIRGLITERKLAEMDTVDAIQQLPQIIQDLSGDCIISSNAKALLSDLTFSELQAMWEAFKRVNEAFLALMPVDQYAERLLLQIRSQLLPPQPLTGDSENIEKALSETAQSSNPKGTAESTTKAGGTS